MRWKPRGGPGELRGFDCESKLKNLGSSLLVFESLAPVIIKDQFSCGVGGLLWEELWLWVNSRFSFNLF